MSQVIKLVHLNKMYGSFAAIRDLSLEVRDAEFFTLLGPSGCGKTTLLRMIAGFNTVEKGEIYFGDRAINNIPAHKRNIGMVFQDYAIFPHLSVEENIRYGLKRHRVPKQEADIRVEEILKLTRIEEYRTRSPERLSGGQQQRVALARAIVIHPTVLLMDEPLSNLDAKLRVEMRAVIRDVQSRIGITTVYVTHDQEEALAVSDRIAVMDKGEIQQVANPRSLYSRPYNLFVEKFIGRANTFAVRVDDDGKVLFGNGYQARIQSLRAEARGKPAVAAARPEELYIAEQGLKATVKKAVFQGKFMSYALEFHKDCAALGQEDAFEFSQDLGTATEFYAQGDIITLGVREDKINLFDHATNTSLMRGVAHYA